MTKAEIIKRIKSYADPTLHEQIDLDAPLYSSSILNELLALCDCATTEDKRQLKFTELAYDSEQNTISITRACAYTFIGN